MRYILTIAGNGSRWNNYLGVRKHFVPIDGEPVILRTIRMIRENDSDCEIYIGQNPRHAISIPDVILYDGTTHIKEAESDRYFASYPYWNKDGRTVLIWGDVFFTEDAIKALCNPSDDWVRFGRVNGYKYSKNKFYGEEFAIAFNSNHHDLMLKACERVERLSIKSSTQLYGAIYLAMLNLPDNDIIAVSNSGSKPNLGNMVEIDDFTDDFDFPKDYDNFIKAWNQSKVST